MSGLLGGGTARQIIVGDEIIRKGSGAPERLELLVDNVVRASLQANMLALLGGAETIESRVTDGASAKALTLQWDANVAALTSGAVPFLLQWINNSDVAVKLLELAWTGGRPQTTYYDDAGAARVAFDTFSGNPSINFLAALSTIQANSGLGRLLLAAANGVELGSGVAALNPLTVQVTNRTGGAVVTGDVVRVSAANDNSVINTTGAGQTSCLVVSQGGADAAIISCVVLGRASVLCTTAAVAPQGILRCSATAKQAETAAAVVGTTIGIALTAKGAGSAGLVSALIGVSV